MVYKLPKKSQKLQTVQFHKRHLTTFMEKVVSKVPKKSQKAIIFQRNQYKNTLFEKSNFCPKIQF